MNFDVLKNNNTRIKKSKIYCRERGESKTISIISEAWALCGEKTFEGAARERYKEEKTSSGGALRPSKAHSLLLILLTGIMLHKTQSI